MKFDELKIFVISYFLCSSLVLANSEQGQSSQSTQENKNAVKFSLSALTEFYTSLVSEKSERKSDESLYLFTGSMVKENNLLAASLVTEQNWNPTPDEDYLTAGDHFIIHKYTTPKKLKFQDYLNPSFESRVILPSSMMSRSNSKLYSLRETVALDGAYKIFSYTLAYKGQVNNYKYETTPIYNGGKYLSDYSNRFLLELGVEIVTGLSLSATGEFGLVHYYDNYEEGVYLFNQTLSYAVKDFLIYAGHETGSTSLVDRGTQNNIKGYDYRTSTITLGAKYALKF